MLDQSTSFKFGLFVVAMREPLSKNPSDAAGQPAIDRQILTRDIGGLIRQQERNSICDLLRPCVAPGRNACASLVLLRQTVRELWQYGIRADAFGGVSVGIELDPGREPGPQHRHRKIRVRLESER